jgi:diguanylate cyclase (GGDEF)-like protein
VRWPAIDAVGVGRFAGLLFSRSMAFLLFGAIGGWADRNLEQSLEKLELYDQIDDETGLYNARFFVQDVDLEMARSRRYKTIFSVAMVSIPAQVFDGLGRRKGRAVLREVGVQLKESVRTMDRAVHAHTTEHKFAVICPETGPEGIRIFSDRLAERFAALVADRGAEVPGGSLRADAYTFPGDDEALAALRAEFEAIDAQEHVVAASRNAANGS